MYPFTVCPIVASRSNQCLWAISHEEQSSQAKLGNSRLIVNNLCSNNISGVAAVMNPQEYAEVVVLAPAGRIDHTSAESFQAELLAEVDRSAAANKHIILDMSAIDYMSSVGLRALMIASKQSKTTDTTIVVAALQPDMKEIFEISRFHFVFKTFDTTDEAIKGFSDAAVSAWSAREGA